MADWRSAERELEEELAKTERTMVNSWNSNLLKASLRV